MRNMNMMRKLRPSSTS